MNLGLIGQSLAHSFSKKYFEEKFSKENLVGYTYTNFDIDNLDNLLQIITDNNISGLNITKPYKETIISFINELDTTAKEIGAVNFVKVIYKNNQPFLSYESVWFFVKRLVF